MAGTPTQKFTTTTSGPHNEKPVAILAVTKIDAVIGSIIQLDGRKSYDPEKQKLTWSWTFNQIPLGSTVVESGFRDIRPGGAAVSFIPDKVGIYVVGLIVNDGELDSNPITATINIQISRVPCGENIVPDAHFLWNYISNFWNLVEDREVITSIWSSTIQVIGSELVKLWGADNNKSIQTIQGSFQRRWVPFFPRTELIQELDQRIIVGKNDSGTGGFTGSIGQSSIQENTQIFYLPKGNVGDVTATDFTNLAGNYGAKGRVIVINSVGYTIQRVSNEVFTLISGIDLVTNAASYYVTIPAGDVDFLSSELAVGDQFEIKTGVDKGKYIVYIIFNELNLYVKNLDGSTPNFVGSSGVSYEATRDYSVVVVDENVIPNGQIGVSWRIPNLLHIPSVNFKEEGVRVGDVVVFEVTRRDIGLTAELRAQVVGVDRTRLGFEFTLDDELSVGEEVIDRDSMRQVVQDLKIIPPDSTQTIINASAEAIISFIPISINLASRPFTTHRLTLKVQRIIHNKVIPFDDNLISVPALQEELKDPPVILRENLDYVVENGAVEFIGGLFTPSDPAPDQLWAECAILDNSEVIENNFGRLVKLFKDDLVTKQIQASYLSAVKGLFFAYTNGPTIANIRLGLQILLGLPFAEEQGIILDIQDEFTSDSNGNPLSRMLVEDVDDANKRLGFRRIYLYLSSIGLETNPSTTQLYKVGDFISRFAPISKGVEVVDYIKDPWWWQRTLYGLEILKYFVFKIVVDGDIFSSDEVFFALEFVNAIKPAYTRVLITALKTLDDTIEIVDEVGYTVTLKFYDNVFGLETTTRFNDGNQQGCILWYGDSKPWATRTVSLLRDVKTTEEAPSYVNAYSLVGWDTDIVRGRSSAVGEVTIEGDLLVIHQGQPGAGVLASGVYEIAEVLDANNLKLLRAASFVDPADYSLGPALDPDYFEYGENLICCIMRRQRNPIIKGDDLTTLAGAGNNTVTSAGANFQTNLVKIGDHLIIEGISAVGNDAGEYIVDALNPYTPDDPWVQPAISETQMRLKNLDGTTPEFNGAVDQDFRIINSRMHSMRVEGAKSVFSVLENLIELEVLDLVAGEPFDIFTPGMVGLPVEVSNSQNPVNDGRWLITKYINCGRVELDTNESGVSDSSAQSIIFIERSTS